MHTYICLLRGINVGGNNKLPMKELRTLLEALGLTNVKSYIQSGNVVFQSERNDRAKLSKEITAAIKRDHGFAPAILLLDQAELDSVMAANPFPQAVDEPKSLHLFFLEPAPEDPDLTALDDLKKETEEFALINKVFYLYAPEGIGRSKLAERFGRGWKIDITARNWRTVCQIREMVAEAAA